jgi:hypothetical protein
MANWSNPLLTSTYTNFLTEVKDRDTDLALQFDGTTSSNIPTGAIRWNSSVNRWQKWNGSSWAELTSTYALTGLSTTGNASIGGTLGSGAITSTGSVRGTALIPTGSSAPANGLYLAGTNTIGLATNSAGRVFIDAAGELGVGTATPGTSVDVTLAAASATIGNVRIAPSVAGQARFHLFNGGGTAEWLFGQKTSTDHSFKLSRSVAGSETDYLTVDTSGRVGIGTISPSAGLDVVADGTTDGMTLKLTAPSTAQGRRATFSLYSTFEGTADNVPRRTADVVAGFNGGAWGSEFLSVGVGRNGAGNDAAARTFERLRINGSGNLGLGTTAPYSRFTVVPASSPSTPAAANQITVGEATANSGYRLQVGYFQGPTSYVGSIQAYDAHNPSSLILNGAGGYVGLGTTAPGTILQVSGNPPNADSGNIYIANSGQARYRLFNGGGQAEWLFGQKTITDHAFKLSKMVAGVENDYLTVTTTGAIGIGNIDPGYALDISSADATAGLGYALRIRTNTTAGAGALQFTNNPVSTQYGFIACDTSSNLKFGAGNNERLRIDSSGRVGIGTSSPSGFLHVKTPATTAGWQLRLDSIGLANESGFYRDASDNYEMVLRNGLGGLSYIKNSGNATDANLVFYPNGVERLRITSAGFLGHNTSSPAAPVHFALPTTSASIGNVYVAPSTAGQARFHLYNGGSTAEWIFGQRTSTDHEFRISTQVAGSETERLRIGTSGQIGIAGANYGTSGQVLTSNGSGSAPSWQSSFKTVAWVNFNGTGTVAIRASGNVSSITDNTVGQYTVNFTSAISDANYAALVSAVDVVAARPHSYATGSVGVYTYDTTNFVDSATVSVAITR